MPAGDRAQEPGELDHLELVEAEPVPGRGAETTVGRMIRPGEDGREACTTLGLAVGIEPQLVQPLLVERQRAPGAVDLEGEMHLAAGRHPARLERAAGATGETDQHAGLVLDLDLADLRRIAGERALGMHRVDVGADRLEITHDVAGERNDVAAEVGHDAGTARRIDGRFDAGAKIALVEDVVTTGASTLEAIDAVEEAGGRVQLVISVVDREESEGIGRLSDRVESAEALVTRTMILEAHRLMNS